MRITDLKSFIYVYIYIYVQNQLLLKNNKIMSFQCPFFLVSLVKVSIKYDWIYYGGHKENGWVRLFLWLPESNIWSYYNQGLQKVIKKPGWEKWKALVQLPALFVHWKEVGKWSLTSKQQRMELIFHFWMSSLL